jgi:hypothetical protein
MIDEFDAALQLRFDGALDIPVRLAAWVNPQADKMSALQKNPRSAGCRLKRSKKVAESLGEAKLPFK